MGFGSMKKHRICPGVLINGQQISAWQVSPEECTEVMVTVRKLVWVALTQSDPRGSYYLP